MLGLSYSIVIEATEDPCFFAFFSPTLEGFTGVGNSVEDCLYKARTGIQEHVEVLASQGLSAPPPDLEPQVLVRDCRSVPA